MVNEKLDVYRITWWGDKKSNRFYRIERWRFLEVGVVDRLDL